MEAEKHKCCECGYNRVNSSTKCNKVTGSFKNSRYWSDTTGKDNNETYDQNAWPCIDNKDGLCPHWIDSRVFKAEDIPPKEKSYDMDDVVATVAGVVIGLGLIFILIGAIVGGR